MAKLIAKYLVSMDNREDIAQIWKHGEDDFEVYFENGDCSERRTFMHIIAALGNYHYIKELEVQ